METPAAVSSAPSKRRAADSIDEPDSKRAAIPPTHKPTLNDLPDELIEGILECFDLSGALCCGYHSYSEHVLPHRRVLHSLILTSRRFHRLAEPHMYRCFWYTYAKQPSLRRFLNRLIARPDLVAKVQTVQLESSAFVSTEEEPPVPPTPECQDFASVARNAGFEGDEHTRFLEAISQGSLDAEIALMLVLATNITSFWMEVPFRPQQYWLPSLLRRQVERHEAGETMDGAPFHALKRVICRHWDSEGGFCPSFLVPFFNLPSVRSIHAWMLAMDYGETESRWPVKSSNVEEIALEMSDVPDDELRRLLAAPKALKSFKYQWGSAVVGAEPFYIDELHRSLALQKHSLESVILDSRESLYVNDFNENEEQRDASFKEFQKLKVLEISQPLFFFDNSLDLDSDSGENDEAAEEARFTQLAEGLPPSLEVIRVNELDEELVMLNVLKVVAELGADRFPQLRTVDIREARKWTGEPSPLILDIRDLFRRSGVNFLPRISRG